MKNLIKKITACLLSIIMIVSLIPCMASAAQAALVFTWAWKVNKIEVDNSATVVSWSGGSNASNRSAFVVFDVPDGFVFNKDTSTAKAQFTINSATLNNGEGNAPTAAVVLVDGDSVKKAHDLNNSSGGTMLKNAVKQGIFKGKYVINSTPESNTLSMDLIDYFEKYPKAETVGVYLTNLTSDGYECTGGIASNMNSFTMDFTLSNGYKKLYATDTEGNVLAAVTAKGSEGDSFKASDYLDTAYYKDNTRYTSKDAEKQYILGEGADEVYIVYEKSNEPGAFYKATNSGYSGNNNREGICVATTATSDATARRAPYVEGFSNEEGALPLATDRIGVLEFEIDPTVDPETIAKAEIRFHVRSVHENANGKWLRLAFYETENPDIAGYSHGGMEQALFSQKNGDYSYESVIWSKETISAASTGWKTADVTDVVVNALDDYNKTNRASNKARVVLRMQVSNSALYVSDAEGANAPYIYIEQLEDSTVAKYDFENLTDSGKAEDLSGNGYDAKLTGDAVLENGKLRLCGNGTAQIDHEAFRDNLNSYTIATTVTLDGAAVNNTRIYDFGSDSVNSGFLKVKDFSVGMKYNNGATTFVGCEDSGKIPFKKSGEAYHIAVSYDDFKKITCVYVNGEKAIETDAIVYGLDDFSDKTPNNFIGRTNWYGTDVAADNPDIKAWYDDFTVYNCALTERCIYAMNNQDFERSVEEAALAVEQEAIEMLQGFLTDNVQFRDSYTNKNGEVFDVTWYSSNPSAIDIAGNVFRNFEDGETVISAEVSKGGYCVGIEKITAHVKGYSESEISKMRILKYTFDDGGKTIVDEGEKHNATATSNLVQRDGRANLGKDNVVKLPNDVNKNVTDYTVAFWVRSDNLSLDGQRIYDFGIENGKSEGNYYAFTRINADGTLSVGMNNGSGSTQTVTSLNGLSEGKWAHVAITYSKKSGETTIYINGDADTASTDITNTMGGAIYNSHSTSNYIGRSQWYLTQSATNPDFEGKLDNFEFYNVCLSKTAIASMMDNLYDSVDVEITSGSLVKGMNRAIIEVESVGYEGEATLFAATYAESMEAVGKQKINIKKGSNSYVVNLVDNGDGEADAIRCFIWESDTSMKPLASSYPVTNTYSFNYDRKYPDNHLLSTQFSLKAYDSDKYLSLANGVSLESWKSNNNLLWTAPYNKDDNAEGYYGLKNVNGTYLALDSGELKTNKINNWRFIQIEPAKAGGKQNVYAILQRSSGKYLVRDQNKVTGSKNLNEAAWWVMDVRKYDTFSEMLISPGFMALSSNEKARLYSVTSQAMWQSSSRRNKLLSYMGSDYFTCDEETQAERLRQIFTYTPSNQVNRGVNTSKTGAHGTYSISEIASSQSYKGKDGENLKGYKTVATYYTDSSKSAVEQTVEIYGRNETVVKNIAKGLGYIPYQFRKYIKTVRDYYHTANQFNCGAKDIYVRTNFQVSAESFAMTASHEVGHSLSFSWGTVHSSGRYTHAMSSDINKISGYGSNNTAEDFAEFTQLVVSSCGDKEVLRMIKVMFPGRFGILRAVLNEMNGGNGLLKDI